MSSEEPINDSVLNALNSIPLPSEKKSTEGRRVTLTESLRDTMIMFSQRKTVGRLSTEHVIFLPQELLEDLTDEIESFIKTTRAIKKRKEWGLPIRVEAQEGLLKGVEFIFEFNPNTNFTEIIKFITDELTSPSLKA